jgi:hypothetical protein
MVTAGSEIFDLFSVLLPDLRTMPDALPKCAGSGMGELINLTEALGNVLIEGFCSVELKSLQSSKGKIGR